MFVRGGSRTPERQLYIDCGNENRQLHDAGDLIDAVASAISGAVIASAEETHHDGGRKVRATRPL
jgi:hypothetical protein